MSQISCLWGLGSCPGFQNLDHAYLAVKKGYIFDVRMLDDILHTRVLSDAAHANTVGVVAPQILHKDVGCVGLGREAIVSNINTGVSDAESIHVERVKAVSVLRQSLENSGQLTCISILSETITEALVENALMNTLSKETSLVRTKKLVQHGEFSCVMPSTLTRVALSVKNRIGR